MVSVEVTFTLKDDRVLICTYGYEVIRGNTCGLPEDSYPDEAGDPTEPEYTLDGDDIQLADMPKGLAWIAEDMYANGESGKYKYTASESASDDFYDPADWRE